MSTRVSGVDPSNRHTGLACAQPAPRLVDRLVDVRRVVMFDGNDGVVRSVRERIHPVLRVWGADTADGWIAVEEAPPTARADMGHGAQGEIGFAQGWLAGMVCGPFLDHEPMRFNPSEWRKVMIAEATRGGLLLQAPTRANVRALSTAVSTAQRFEVKRDGTASIVHWIGCSHTLRCETFAALATKPARCPECERSPATADREAAEAVRAAWKALACRFVSHFWPVHYKRLVGEARATARRAMEDHEVAGVADACEAVGIALAGVAERCST